MQTRAQAEATKYNWVLKASKGYQQVLLKAIGDTPELQSEAECVLTALDKLIAKVDEHNAQLPFYGKKNGRPRNHSRKIFVR